MLAAALGGLLILRVWHSLDWEMHGTWWGFGLLLFAVAAVHLRDQMLLEVAFGPRARPIPPAALGVLAYAVGMILLFGGTRLLRRAIFPIALLAFVEPVPVMLQERLDFRLFRLSVAVARGAEHLFDQNLTPAFARFVSPHDTGLRGALTLGLLALAAGYAYRFRLRAWGAAILVALVLGVVLDLVRIALLVACFAIPPLRNHLAAANYLLGLGVFFAGTMALLGIIRRCSPAQDWKPPSLPVETDAMPAQSFGPRCVALAMLLLLGSIQPVRALLHRDLTALSPFLPQGTYILSREFDEPLPSGGQFVHWAEYISPSGGPMISVGLAWELPPEEALRVLTANRLGLISRGSVSVGSRTALESFYADGVEQTLQVVTVCDGTTCELNTALAGHILYSRPDPRGLATQAPIRPVLLVLQVEALDAGIPPALARQQLLETLRQFMGSAPMAALADPYQR